MKYTINTEECEKLGINFPTFLYLLSVYSKQLITESCAYVASSKSLMTFRGKDAYGNPISPELTDYGKEVVEEILKNSMFKIPSDEEIATLATTLRNLWPAGVKPGTPYKWKGSQRDIENRLKKFFILYGSEYTEEQVVSAARDYVNAFNGDYRFMRLLKYFIWKKEDGTESSDLASYIDNEGQEDSDYGESWVNELK